jgi:integrase
LIENKIKRLNQITIKTLKDFQYCLIEKKNKKGERLLSNGTINDRIDGALKPIFTNLLLQGIIKTSPFIGVKFNLPESDTENRLDILPIYKTYSVLHNADIWRLYKSESDIIKNKIANLRHYKKYRLICLLSATCGLRDAEIFYLRKSYLIKIRRVPFLEIVNSHNPKKEQGLKTENSKRKVPVPTITLQALNEYIAENNITDYLFYSGSGGIHYNMFGFTKNNFACHCGYNEKEIADKNFDFYSFRHLYKSIFNGSGIDENIVEYFFGHKTDLRKMNQRYNNRESLDEEFFETFGLQVIEFIDDLFLRVLKKYDLLPSTYTHIEQVSLTDNKNITRNYYTEVLDDFSFEEEIYHILGGFVDKGLLKSLNDKNGLKELIETNQIDKKLFDDCIYYIENNKI